MPQSNILPSLHVTHAAQSVQRSSSKRCSTHTAAAATSFACSIERVRLHTQHGSANSNASSSARMPQLGCNRVGRGVMQYNTRLHRSMSTFGRTELLSILSAEEQVHTLKNKPSGYTASIRPASCRFFRSISRPKPAENPTVMPGNHTVPPSGPDPCNDAHNAVEHQIVDLEESFMRMQMAATTTRPFCTFSMTRDRHSQHTYLGCFQRNWATATYCEHLWTAWTRRTPAQSPAADVSASAWLGGRWTASSCALPGDRRLRCSATSGGEAPATAAKQHAPEQVVLAPLLRPNLHRADQVDSAPPLLMSAAGRQGATLHRMSKRRRRRATGLQEPSAMSVRHWH